jgi:peptidoglycan/xylan/chitin deacetylase (PgdA/CDA1 family)
MLKQLFLTCADLIGLNWLFRQLNKHKIPILMYHGIEARQFPYSCWTILPREKFIRQLQYLKKKYTIVSLAEVISSNSANETPRAVITFDDGLLNTYQHAWPVLKELQCTATVFIIPQLSQEGKLIWADQVFSCLTAIPAQPVNLTSVGFGEIPASSIDDRVKRVDTILIAMKTMPHATRQTAVAAILQTTGQNPQANTTPFGLMTPEQIKELANSKEFTICAHTNTHSILSTQNWEEQKTEIDGSISAIKQWNIPTAPLFAYPNGRAQDFTDETITLVKEAGCKAAVSTIDGLFTPGDDLFRIKRVNIGGDISDAEFRARCSGLYYFITHQTGK